MESAARVHWRAAAWLLERTDPERYARRPASSASPVQFDAALTFVLEAALEAVAPEQQEAVYEHVQAACERAFDCVFPNYGPWGNPRSPKLPPTPLVDEQLRHCSEWSRSNSVADDDEAGAPVAPQSPAEVAPPPAPGPTTQRPPHDPWWEASPTLVLRDGDGGREQHATPAADNPSWAAAPSPAAPSPAAPSPPAPSRRATQTPPLPQRLPWQDRLRRASSPAAPRRGTGRVDDFGDFGEGILSPKMRAATEFDLPGERPLEFNEMRTGESGVALPAAAAGSETTRQMLDA